MEESGQEIGKMARARVMAEEYARASDSLGALEAERDEERRVLRKMKRGAAALAVLCALLLIAVLVMMCAELSATYPLPLLVVVGSIELILGCAIPAAMVAFAPAGFIGMWRAIKRSGWIVWGGGIVMLIAMVVLLYVPILGGVFFFIGQLRRVKRLDAEVLSAEKRLEEASAAIF